MPTSASLTERWVTLTSATTGVPQSEENSQKKAELDGSAVGFVVFDLTHGKRVRLQNPGKAFLPASVAKIPTALYALENLGAQFRFRTGLRGLGQQVGDHWRGDLYLQGSGDPLFTVADLMSLAQALQRRGVRKMTGHFFYDASTLVQVDRITDGQPEDAAYNAGVSALSLDFNRFRVKWGQGAEKGILEGFTIPELPSVRLGLSPQARRPADHFSYDPDANGERWLLTKEADPSGVAELPVHQPARFTALLFQRLCRGLGIAIPVPEAGGTPPKAATFREVLSAPAIELVARGLEYSNNLVMELLLLAAAKKQTGRALTIPEAAQAARSWWASRIPAANWSGFVLENGSGLGTRSRITPQQMASILQWADKRTYDGRSLLSLLPIAGMKGSLQYRLELPLTSLNVWAKTGTMLYGTSLAGYFFPRSGTPHLFAIFINDLGRRRTDGHTPQSPESDAWLDRARTLQEDLLTQWVAEF